MKFNPFVCGAILVFYLIPFQDLVISYLFLVGFPQIVLKFLIVLKEIIVLSLGAILFLRLRISPIRLFLIIFLLYTLITIPFSTISLYNTVLGLRTYLLLVFSFMIGEQVSKYPNFFNRFEKHLTIIFTSTFIFSFLEFFVLPMSIWKYPFPIMEMKRVVANLNTTNEYYDYGYPVNAFGELTRRMLGPFDEPLYMAYFTVIILNFYIVNLIINSGKSKQKAIIGAILVILTQTRAVILGFIFSFIAFLTQGLRVKKNHIIIAAVIFVLLIPFIVYYSSWILMFINSIFDGQGRNRGHLDAYLTGFSLLIRHPFGLGVGSASSLVGFSDSNNATENAFINVGLEIGFFGMISLIALFTFLIMKFRKFTLIMRESREHQVNLKIVSAGYLLMIQFTFAALVAPHILTARILIPFMIVIGWAYGSTTITQKA